MKHFHVISNVFASWAPLHSEHGVNQPGGLSDGYRSFGTATYMAEHHQNTYQAGHSDNRSGEDRVVAGVSLACDSETCFVS